MKALKFFGLAVSAVVVAYGAYVLYLSFYPYLANGAVPGNKVAERASANNDLEACGKIKTYPFPLFMEGFDITRDEIKAGCYYKLAELKKDESICNYARLYVYRPDDYVRSCEQNAVSRRLTWGEVFFVFTDARGPLINVPVELREAITCKPGETCNPTVLFSGLTDKSGNMMVIASAIHGQFNVAVGGRNITGPFRVIKADHPAYTFQYPDGTTRSFNAQTDTVEVMLQATN